MKLHKITFILLVIGGLNWLAIGLGGFMHADWNLVALLLGAWPQVEWLVYLLVGLSAVYEIATHMQNCKECSMK